MMAVFAIIVVAAVISFAFSLLIGDWDGDPPA